MNNKNDIWQPEEHEKRRTCMLMITHACNLNCTYCYEAHKSNKMMTFEMAKEKILKECEIVLNDDHYEELEIDLMGGEPMTNFPLIKQLVEWAEKDSLPIPYIFFLTSNGTLFDEEAKKWFYKHRKNIYVGVSYDGTTAMQNTNRGNISNNIDFDFFINTWPDQGFHTTISRETLPVLTEGIIHIQKKNSFTLAVLATGIDWQDEDALVYYKQLDKLSEMYLEDETLVPSNILTRYLNVCTSQEELDEKMEKYCGVGTAMATYDVNGKTYGCHMFSPIVLGDNAVETQEINWACESSLEDPFCKSCVLKKMCPTCVGFNLRFRGHIALRDHRWCNLILAQAIKACEFQIAILSKRRDSLDEKDASYSLKALEAYPILNNFSIEKSKAPFSLNEDKLD